MNQRQSRRFCERMTGPECRDTREAHRHRHAEGTLTRNMSTEFCVLVWAPMFLGRDCGIIRSPLRRLLLPLLLPGLLDALPEAASSA